MQTKAGALHKWEHDYQPPAAASSSCPLAVIRVTSIPEHPRPWFVVTKPAAGIRKEFIDETIAMLFGYQPGGAPHNWEEAGTISEEAEAAAVANGGT